MSDTPIRWLALALAAGIGAAAPALAAGPAATRGLHDDPAFALYRQAVAAFEQKAYERAFALARESLTHYPDNLEAHYLLGRAAMARERWEAAVRAFRKVVALSASSFAGHRELGIALEQLGRVDEAARAYEAALALEPQAEDVALRLAFLELRAGDRDAAFTRLEGLAKGGTTEPEVWATLGRLYYECEAFEESERAFGRAAELADDAKAWFNLGVVRLRLEDDAGALAAFRKAARDPELRAKASVQIEALEARVHREPRRRAPGPQRGERARPGGAAGTGRLPAAE